MTFLLPAFGTAILLIIAVDVFSTVFNPEGHGGPLTRLQGRLVWNAWKAVAPRNGAARDSWLALGGPFLAVLAPTTWSLMLIAGFALIYYPWILSFLVSPGSLRVPWTEALYYSGFSAATLGTGDVVADMPSLRLLTVVEALSGFALLSASLSYILAIYRENGTKMSLAAELALHHDVEWATEGLGPAAENRVWRERVAREFLHTINAHAQYPILHYFRPREDSSSLALQIGPLLEHVRTQRQSSRAADSPTGLVEAAVDRYLDASDSRFIPQHFSGGGHHGDARHARLLEYLGYSADKAAGVRPEE